MCKVEYTDFCVCVCVYTFLRDERSSYDDSEIHIERIYKNPTFRAECVKKHNTFTICLLPELMGNLYMRPTLKSTSDNHNITDVTNGPSTHVAISEATNMD